MFSNKFASTRKLVALPPRPSFFYLSPSPYIELINFFPLLSRSTQLNTHVCGMWKCKCKWNENSIRRTNGDNFLIHFHPLFVDFLSYAFLISDIPSPLACVTHKNSLLFQFSSFGLCLSLDDDCKLGLIRPKLCSALLFVIIIQGTVVVCQCVVRGERAVEWINLAVTSMMIGKGNSFCLWMPNICGRWFFLFSLSRRHRVLCLDGNYLGHSSSSSSLSRLSLHDCWPMSFSVRSGCSFTYRNYILFIYSFPSAIGIDL